MNGSSVSESETGGRPASLVSTARGLEKVRVAALMTTRRWRRRIKSVKSMKARGREALSRKSSSEGRGAARARPNVQNLSIKLIN